MLGDILIGVAQDDAVVFFAGDSKVVRFSYETPTPISGKYLRIEIDTDGQVLELDETNNTVLIRVP